MNIIGSIDRLGMKPCSKCRVPKELSEFGKHKTGKDGHRGRCKSCCAEQAKEWYEANKEQKKNGMKPTKIVKLRDLKNGMNPTKNVLLSKVKNTAKPTKNVLLSEKKNTVKPTKNVLLSELKHGVRLIPINADRFMLKDDR